jgi:hypothetical protein
VNDEFQGFTLKGRLRNSNGKDIPSERTRIETKYFDLERI